LSRTIQDRTGLSLRRFLRTLKPLRSATIEINGVINTYPPSIDPNIQAILTALEQPPPRH
ncbi:MAG: IS1634 family transposase, partial [Gordonia sp. (in: high G+C Gram-positive bacteria)]